MKNYLPSTVDLEGQYVVVVEHDEYPTRSYVMSGMELLTYRARGGYYVMEVRDA